MLHLLLVITPALQHHLAVKSSIDLLLVFVSYSASNDSANGTAHSSSMAGRESPARLDSPDTVPNALLLKDAVEEVSDQLGIIPWKYVLDIFSEKSVADQDMMAKAFSLINKVC